MANFEEGSEDRTEEATPHRREEFRKEGQTAQSRELGAALVLLTVTLSLYLGAKNSLNGIGEVFESSFLEMGQMGRGDLSVEKIIQIARFAFKALFFVLAPVIGGALIIGILSSVMQTGFIWTTKPFEFDLEKLNPMRGFSRIFSMEGFFELFKSVIKFIVVGVVVYFAGLKDLFHSGSLMQMESAEVFSYLGKNLFRILLSMGIAFFILSLMDFGFQRFRFEQKLKMTKQEVKQDRKEQDGNPQVKARIRGIQRQMATRRMMDAVKKADVVVTNPTHIAVALVYDRETMLAPKVVAKGADFMAEQIKKIARESGIPCVENVPLARAMYKAYKIGQLVSRDLYNAVAEVLAYVYRLKGKNL